jgi:D-hexose-6-phosphate mutarotase
MNTLEQIRKEWEKGATVHLVVADGDVHYLTIYVLLSRTKHTWLQPRYSLHKYFKVGDNWEVSVEVDNTLEVENCYKEINEAFSKLVAVVK